MNSVKPNLIIVGAQKSGTTSIHNLLSRQNFSFTPRIKELHFFDRERITRKSLDRYLNKFDTTYALKFETTPSYLHHPKAAQRIKKYLGSETKIIIVLRHPVDRAISHYWHEVKLGWESADLKDALIKESVRIKRGKKHWAHYSYCSRGFYTSFIDNYYLHFPSENIKVLSFDDIKKDPGKVLSSVIDFLGVDSEYTIGEELIGGERNSAQIPKSKILSKASFISELIFTERNIFSRLIYKINLKNHNYGSPDPDVINALHEAFSCEVSEINSKFNINLDTKYPIVESVKTNTDLVTIIKELKENNEANLYSWMR